MNDNASTSDSTLSDRFDDYDPDSETLYTRFDGDPGDLVAAIVEAVAVLRDRDAHSLSPLYATVDPDALVAIAASSRDEPVEVSFSYERCRVTVSSRGDVVVELPTG